MPSDIIPRGDRVAVVNEAIGSSHEAKAIGLRQDRTEAAAAAAADATVLNFVLGGLSACVAATPERQGEKVER